MLLVVVCCLLLLLVLLFCKSVSSIILGFFRRERERECGGLDLGWNVGVGGVIKNFVGGFKKTDVSLSAFYFIFLLLSDDLFSNFSTPSPSLLFFPNSKRKRKKRERNTVKFF